MENLIGKLKHEICKNTIYVAALFLSPHLTAVYRLAHSLKITQS